MLHHMQVEYAMRLPVRTRLPRTQCNTYAMCLHICKASTTYATRLQCTQRIYNVRNPEKLPNPQAPQPPSTPVKQASQRSQPRVMMLSSGKKGMLDCNNVSWRCDAMSQHYEET